MHNQDNFFAIPSKTPDAIIANPFGRDEEKEAPVNPFVSMSEQQVEEQAAAEAPVKQYKKGETLTKTKVSEVRGKVTTTIPESISQADDQTALMAMFLTYKSERERRARIGAITEKQCREDIARAELLSNAVMKNLND